MRITVIVAAILLLAINASASLQEKWVASPIGTIEEAEFVQDIYPDHGYYLGYDFVGVRIYPNETAQVAVNVVNRDNRFREMFLMIDCQGRSDNEVVALAPGSARLVESGLFPYKDGKSFTSNGTGLGTYDIFVNLVADWGQPPLMAQVKIDNNETGLGNWFTGLYN